ncbi:LuxR C-terminal-related transcriptional regulator, partial [Jatrophihabitans sp.]|uniref:helix-turn-helix transcriptional regulator n=1 Tax=Jatrophihabitans sp. TaxID=1932789 RepID=UPI0030C6C643|nr:putative transcriptional regulator, LuxR family [Jatrophihabitans sp.]
DDESSEALSWLVRRASVDRLLVAVTHRPLTGTHHARWRRWVESDGSVHTLRLSGLSLGAATELVRDEHPDLSSSDAERLWRHTGGNPLYLRALLSERTSVELRATRMLPAPTEYAQDIESRLARMSHDAVRLAEALAVLASSWTPVVDAVTLAGLAVGDDALQELLEHGLLEVADAGGGFQVRWVHALSRAAVYEHLSLPRRRALHAEAARLVSSLSVVFEHRLAAADRYDEQLAIDMEQYAEQLQGQRSYRNAALFERWASGLTASPGERQRRWLDSLYLTLMSRDFESVRLELDDLDRAGDEERRVLLLGALACLEGRHRDGVTHLGVVAEWPTDQGDARTRYRIEAFLAWSRTLLGEEPAVIGAGLQRASLSSVQDQGVQPFILLAQGHVAGRTSGWDGFAALFDLLPPTASAVPAELAGLLVWRGAERLARVELNGSIADLREVQFRQHEGVVDALTSGFDALLAAAYWFHGRWSLARVAFGGALEVPAEVVGLLTHSLAPLTASGMGDFATADRLLHDGASALDERPWLEAVETHLAARVVRLHAAGDRDGQASLLRDIRGRWPSAQIGRGLNTGLWAAHFALAHCWAGELDEADAQRARARGASRNSPGLAMVCDWVEALVLEARGEQGEALRCLAEAVARDGADLPLYQGHALADHARLAEVNGLHAVADASRRQALTIYESLQATPYIERLRSGERDAPRGAAEEYVLPLTDREHDVLTLVLEGYSYAQISRELFVSQSTVSYHLGNIYPKAGVRSRHELTDWVRRHPGSLSPHSSTTASH